MALSFTQSSGDGVSTDYPVTFQYLSRSHVSVTVDGVSRSFTWLNDALLRVTPAPGLNTVVEVKRTTPRTRLLVDFTDGSTLTESDLDTATLQSFFLAQEAFDIAGGTLGIQSDGSYSANNRRIGALANPVNAQDAVTKAWAEDTTNTNVGAAIVAKDAAVAAQAGAQTARTGAETAQTGAQTARTGAQTARTGAEDARDTALAHRTGAETARTGAETARTGAETAQTGAQTARTGAEDARDAALNHRNAAAASAQQAALFDPSNYVPKSGGTFTGHTGVSEGIQWRFGGGGYLSDQATGGSLNAGRTVLAAKNSSFDIITGDGSGFLARFTTSGLSILGQPVWHAGNLSPGMVKLAGAVVSGVTQIQLSLPSGYTAFRLILRDINPSSQGFPLLYLRRVGQSGVDGSAGAYSWSGMFTTRDAALNQYYSASSTGVTAAIVINASNVLNGAPLSGVFDIFQAVSSKTHVVGHSSVIATSTGNTVNSALSATVINSGLVDMLEIKVGGLPTFSGAYELYGMM